MKDEKSVVDLVDDEVPEQEEQLRIRKVSLGTFTGELPKIYGSVLQCGTCENTGCSSQICTNTCDTNF